MILRRDSEDSVLYVLVLVDFRLVKGLVEIRWVVILVGDSDTDELCHWKKKNRDIRTKKSVKWDEIRRENAIN